MHMVLLHSDQAVTDLKQRVDLWLVATYAVWSTWQCWSK